MCGLSSRTCVQRDKQGENLLIQFVALYLRLLAGGRDLPHIYHDPDRLCLYLPGTGQWDASKRLNLTIIPWTHLWLIYFEEWLVSDDWKGGGKHPGEDDPDEGNRGLRRSLRRMH